MWINLFATLALLMGASGPAGGSASPTGEVCTVEVLILSTPKSVPQVQSAKLVTEGRAEILMEPPFTMRWGREVLSSDGPVVRINGLAIPEARAEETGEGLSVQAAPVVRTNLGQAAEIKTGGGPPIQYMTKEADGHFSLHTLDKTPELHVTLLPRKASSRELVRLDLDYRIVQIGARHRLPGVLLDIGAPAVNERGAKVSEEVRLGQWHLLGLGDGPPTGIALLVKLRMGK